MRADARGNVKRWALGGALVLMLFGSAGCKPGSPPQIVDPGNQVAVVGETLTLNLFASDADGDPLTYRFRAEGVPDINAHAMLGRAPDGHGVFTFTPVGGQEGTHIFDFIVSDGDFDTTLPITIEVRGASGSESAPIFREPQAGVVLNLTEDVGSDCAYLEILVEDSDSTEIELTQLPPSIPGAQLDAASNGLEGSWEWCPSREQREVFQYRVTLSADDHDNPATIKDIPIVLRRPTGEGCPGEEPVITHTPNDFNTLLDLEITAEVGDDVGLKSPPVIFYAYEDPRTGAGIAWDRLSVADMNLESGDMRQGTWVGSIPNPTVSGGVGTSAEVFYIIEVVDDDDTEGECDHRTDSPMDGVHIVNVENTGEGGAGLCEACSFDVQCGGEEDNCLQLENGTVCGRGCADDCPAGYVCSTDPVSSVDGAVSRQCVPESGVCGDEQPSGECNDDGAEDDDDPDQAREYAPVTETYEGTANACPHDPDWWFVELAATAQVTVTLSGDSPPDMDLTFANADGESIDLSAAVGSEESVDLGCLDAGEYFAVVEIYDADAGLGGGYSLSFTIDEAACEMADPLSCEGNCGSEAPGGCFCDDLCTQTSDCCDDYELQCL
jgi:hypothetical protein